MRPNFLVIGAMKCATSTLCAHLGRHPQVFMTSPKEPNFFSNDDAFARGWEWYEGLFEGSEGKLARGEGNTANTRRLIFPNASARIAKHLPHAKLIYIVRHPLARIESHWMTCLGRTGDGLSFEQFVARWPETIDTSCYWRQISAYRAHFPDEQILVLFFEDFIKDPVAALKRCFEFLHVDVSLSQVDPKLHVFVSNDQRIDGRLIRIARTLPGLQSLKAWAPQLSRAVGSRLRRTMPDRPIWSSDLRREVIDQVSGDVASFLRHYGKPADWWRFD